MAGSASGTRALVISTRTGASVATTRQQLFSIVRVDPEFSPETYAMTFAALQRPPCAKLLDLTPARLFSADLFDRLAGAWTAPSGTVPRLGILLSFERRVTLRAAALIALQPLAARGVRVDVFYEEQVWGNLGVWFQHGQVVHNLPAVISTLALRWQPSATWPAVIDTLTRLVRANSCAAELAPRLTDVAGLALWCGGAEQAAMLAREVLYYLPETPSTTRGKALRELGTALMSQGQSAAGLALLDHAIAMAAAANDPMLGTSALCQAGLYALHHGDYATAECRFRGAIELLSLPPHRPQLLALAHHSLSIALMHQQHRNDEAKHHAIAALALRADPSQLADEDRIFLSRLRVARAEVN